MKASEIVKQYQELIEKHGDLHVILGEDDYIIATGVRYDEEREVFETTEVDASGEETEVMVTCEHCSERFRKDKMILVTDDEDLYGYDTYCEKCVDEFHIVRPYKKFKYTEDENGNFTKIVPLEK